MSRLVSPLNTLQKWRDSSGKNEDLIECHKNGVKRRKCHLRETKSAKFRGGGECPETSALKNTPYFPPKLKRGWNLCRSDNLENQIHFLAELHFHLVPSLFLLL